MQRVRLRKFCGALCCPPFPSRIVSKLAFQPPVPATYSFYVDDAGRLAMKLRRRSDWPYTQMLLRDAIEFFYATTARGSQVACMFVRCSPFARFTVLFSHSNAIDLGGLASWFLELGEHINCNVFGYDYSGYGASTGRPSEKDMYADIDAAWNALRARYGVLPENVILYGQSIGTVAAVDLASRCPDVAAVVLHSPLASGLRVVFRCQSRRTSRFDAFASIDKISGVLAPVLVIHGTDDDVVDMSHGVALYERCPRPVRPLWVEGAGHGDVEFFGEYIERLERFVAVELPKLQAKDKQRRQEAV